MSTNANDLFVIATRKKYRFASRQGEMMAEDLWDLDLPVLDRLAVAIDEALSNTSNRKTFISTQSNAQTAAATELSNKLEIIKHVIETKLAEAEAAKARATKAAQKAFLVGLLEKKKIESLEGLDAGEIEKQIASLDAA